MQNKIAFVSLSLLMTAIAAFSAEVPTWKKLGSSHHVVVYQQEERFAGWPANNGAWNIDGRRMLVGFTNGRYELKSGHNIAGPHHSWLAESANGGETWEAWDPEGYVGDFGSQPELRKLDNPVDFTRPRLAMRIVGTRYHGASDPRGHFFYSYDAGHTWQGPFPLAGIRDCDALRDSKLATQDGQDALRLPDMTARTDYVVLDQDSALFFFTASQPGRSGTNRVFCARSNDGGRTFRFVGWVVPPFTEDDPHPRARTIMPSTVLMPGGRLVTAFRCIDQKGNGWIECCTSTDQGRSWNRQTAVEHSGSKRGGNPPALSITDQGCLVLVFGDRDGARMLAVSSRSAGRNWSEPRTLRDDFWSEDGGTEDLGYPRLLKREDGRMVAIYYWSTKDALHNISATVFDPDEL